MKIPFKLQMRPSCGRWMAVGAVSLALISIAEAAPSWRVPAAKARIWVQHFAALPLAAEVLRPAEQAFLESALTLSRQEVRLAQLTMSQASNGDVRTVALQLSGDQRQLRESIEGLLRKRGVAVPADQPVPEAHQRLMEMTGTSFDREVVMTLNKVHEELVTLFEQATSDAKDTEIRELTGRLLPILREHRQRLIELRKLYE